MESIVAVVTGGTKGIGLGIAESLVKRNAAVAVTYHSDDTAARAAGRRLEDLADGRQKIRVLKGSVGDEQQITDFLGHFAFCR